MSSLERAESCYEKLIRSTIHIQTSIHQTLNHQGIKVPYHLWDRNVDSLYDLEQFSSHKLSFRIELDSICTQDYFFTVHYLKLKISLSALG